jgi:hypothetical protein
MVVLYLFCAILIAGFFYRALILIESVMAVLDAHDAVAWLGAALDIFERTLRVTHHR